MMLMRTYYEKFHYPQRDFMRPIGEISFHFLSRAPQPTQNYNTLIHPCDYYVWALIAASVMAVTLALLIVDISYAKWTNTSMKGVFHHSMFNLYQMAIITVNKLSFQTSALGFVQLWMRVLWISTFARALAQRPEKLSFLCGYYWDF